jgi:hypothetical protein
VQDDALETLMRAKIGLGKLPTSEPVKMWGAYGSGAPCDACDLPITVSDAAIEVADADCVERVYHVHCHALLSRIRLRLIQAPK